VIHAASFKMIQLLFNSFNFASLHFPCVSVFLIAFFFCNDNHTLLGADDEMPVDPDQVEGETIV